LLMPLAFTFTESPRRKLQNSHNSCPPVLGYRRFRIMKISLLTVLALVSIAGLACASIANANSHWYTWLEIFSWILFGLSFIVAFHTRSTVVAAFPIFFVVTKVVLEDHENYLFHWVFLTLDLEGEYAIRRVVRHLAQIAFPCFGSLMTAVVLGLCGRQISSATRQARSCDDGEPSGALESASPGVLAVDDQPRRPRDQ